MPNNKNDLLVPNNHFEKISNTKSNPNFNKSEKSIFLINF